MEKDFLTEAQMEGESIDSLEETLVEPDNAFDDEPSTDSQAETENSDESSAETNENEQEPSQEGEPEKDNTPMEENVPFHKHPRFKEIIEENKKLKDDLEKTREDVYKKLEESKPQPTEQIPESFKKLYGDSPEIWTVWKQYLSEEKAKMKEEFFSDLRKEQEEKLKQEQIKVEKQKEAQKYFENQFAEIEAKDGKVDRNAIVKVLEKYHCINPDTQMYDIKAAYDLYKQLHKPDTAKSNIRKEIAGNTTSSGNASQSDKKITWDALKKKSWGDF